MAAIDLSGEATFDYNTEAELFDYGAETGLFPATGRKSRRKVIRYRRFVRAADAIRFAIEELPLELLAGAYLEVDAERFGSRAIRGLYDSLEYPLIRRAAA
jgi:hypothetical protein